MKKTGILLACINLYSLALFARVGGGGGHNSHSSGGGGGFSGGLGGGHIGLPGLIFIIIVVLIIYYVKNKNNGGGNTSDNRSLMDNLGDGLADGLSGGILGAITGALGVDTEDKPVLGHKNFPEGLTQEKIATSFMELQAAWQQQDLGKVRKWMSDGVYQRFTAQFDMMKKLTQRNLLNNIRIHDISVAATSTDGPYQTADIAITFSMDDRFVCEKYPSLNETYPNDTDTEYWTYIKRKDAKATPGTDLYSSNNCPNCGASLENMLGEVSRCSSCGTLTNNAAYDWVLSEITQDEDYQGSNRLINDPALHEIVQHDNLFAVQRMEDIASNVFMQIMEVLGGDNNKKLARFADNNVAAKILQLKNNTGNFVFDRLYLDDVTLSHYDTNNQRLNLSFNLTVSYQRVQTGDRLIRLDRDISEHNFSITLSKDLAALNAPEKEIAFSYECASCGAPYNDTTNDTCTYCDAPVVNTASNWVLTGFDAY